MALIYLWLKQHRNHIEGSDSDSSDSVDTDGDTDYDDKVGGTVSKQNKVDSIVETSTAGCRISMGRRGHVADKKGKAVDGSQEMDINKNMISVKKKTNSEVFTKDSALDNVPSQEICNKNITKADSETVATDSSKINNCEVDHNDNVSTGDDRKARNTDKMLGLKTAVKYKDGQPNIEFLPCLICQTTFANKPEVMRHMTKIHRLTNLCQICYFDDGEIKRFANPVSLRNHKVRDHPEDMVKCVCGAMLIDNKMLTSHLKKFKCHIFETGTGPMEMVRCICGKRFGTQQLLLNHRSKCRKRHCIDDDIFQEYMKESKRPKRKCLRRLSVDNLNVSETKTSSELLMDLNNNPVVSEDSDSSFGRVSKLRKCKENVVTYSEKAYDKIFEKVVNPVLDLSCCDRAKKKSVADIAICETRETSRRLSETLGSGSEDVLDLRIKKVLDRDNSGLNKRETVSDSNCNSACNSGVIKAEEPEVKAKFATTSNAPKSGKKNIENVVEKLRQAIQVKTETAEIKHETIELKYETEEHKTGLEVEKLNEETPYDQAAVRQDTNRKYKKKEKKGRRKKKPDADGRYPCKKCRKRYKRPYLYVHQKYAHAPRQWILVPTAALRKKPGKL